MENVLKEIAIVRRMKHEGRMMTGDADPINLNAYTYQ